ncbi:MAG: hypothetical protein CL693_20070 [Cellvibrionaceae bacterium]|nr:hypothetical protein [Cellvibrionaceae bacterium]
MAITKISCFNDPIVFVKYTEQLAYQLLDTRVRFLRNTPFLFNRPLLQEPRKASKIDLHIRQNDYQPAKQPHNSAPTVKPTLKRPKIDRLHFSVITLNTQGLNH